MKKMLIQAVILLSAICVPSTAFPQDLPVKTEQQWEQQADALEGEQSKDDSHPQQLAYFRKHPLNLNEATEADLLSLRLLNDLQIHHLLRYRSLLGHFIHVNELQAVPLWDLATIEKLLPFVRVSDPANNISGFRQRLKGGEHLLLLRAGRKWTGDTTARYMGDPFGVLVRYRFQFRNLLQWGLVADKDAGEPLFGRSSFDFYSFHFFTRNLGRVRALALGDYAVNLGQGLILWQSTAFGKGPEVMGIKRQSPVLQPHRSSGAFYFNRGGALTIGGKKWEATAFVSYRDHSALVDSSGDFSSLQTSGLHRTEAERRSRNTVSDLSFGGNAGIQLSGLKVGFNLVSHHFSGSMRNKEEPYQYFAFRGHRLLQGSFDYAFTWRNLHLFGEAATDPQGHTALVTGALLSLDPKADLSLLYRHMSPGFPSLFGQAFTENTLPANETGFYTGLILRPVHGWQLQAFADVFSFPWLRYRADAPGWGRDCLVQLDYRPNKRTFLYLLFRSRSRPLNVKGIITDYPESKVRESFRLHWNAQLDRAFSLRSRLELSWYDRGGREAQSGFLGYVEGRVDPGRWGVGLRLQYFETDGYDSRIYAYEPDVPSSVSIPAFSGTGFRYSLHTRYDPHPRLAIWLRWALSVPENGDGSVQENLTNGNPTSMTLQVQFRF